MAAHVMTMTSCNDANAPLTGVFDELAASQVAHWSIRRHRINKNHSENTLYSYTKPDLNHNPRTLTVYKKCNLPEITIRAS